MYFQRVCMLPIVTNKAAVWIPLLFDFSKYAICNMFLLFHTTQRKRCIRLEPNLTCSTLTVNAVVVFYSWSCCLSLYTVWFDDFFVYITSYAPTVDMQMSLLYMYSKEHGNCMVFSTIVILYIIHCVKCFTRHYQLCSES